MVRVLAILALTASAAWPQDGAKDPVRAEVAAKLRNVRVSLDFRQAPLESALDVMRELAGINMIVGPKARALEAKVTIKVQDLPMRAALRLMLASHDLTWDFRHGVVFITTREEAMDAVVTEIYDVRDLTHPVASFPGVELDLVPGGLGVVASVEPEAGPEMPVVDLVKAHTGGKSWDENPRASINLHGGLLVVRQTREVHRQVQRVIGKLRGFK